MAGNFNTPSTRLEEWQKSNLRRSAAFKPIYSGLQPIGFHAFIELQKQKRNTSMATYIITAIKPHSKPIQIKVDSPQLKAKWLTLYKRNRYRTHVKTVL
jgi:hypothetical protein